MNRGAAPTVGGTGQDRLSELARTINDNPDRFHGDATPSVQALVCEGKNAIPPMLDLMVSGDETTRWRVQVVLEALTFEMYGSRRPQWEAFWRRMGDLDYRAGNEKQLMSVSLWREWLGSGCPGCPAPNARRSQGLY